MKNYHIPPSVFDEQPVLLQTKRRMSLNPFSYVWTAMEHVAYWFAPANSCVYCWVWRMWLVGFVCGAWAWPWIGRLI